MRRKKCKNKSKQFIAKKVKNQKCIYELARRFLILELVKIFGEETQYPQFKQDPTC